MAPLNFFKHLIAGIYSMVSAKSLIMANGQGLYELKSKMHAGHHNGHCSIVMEKKVQL